MEIMRYYDLIETPKTEKTFTESGTNRIAETHESVKCWFKPLPNGFKRGYLDDGLPILIEVPQPTQQELEAIAIKNAIAKFTQKTNDRIQSKINTYNAENGTAFTNVHNCESYSRLESYTHKEFCLKVWQYNVALWEIVRTYQNSLIEIPSDEQFEIVLNSVEW